MKKIIYIISLGRSGSTILDIILGNGKDILSCGELNRYAISQGKPGYWRLFKDSPTFLFWDKINTKLAKRFYDNNINYLLLKELIRKYEYHTAFFTRSKAKRKDFKEYSYFLLSLYQILFETIDNSIIVDSSKYPARALRLAEIASPHYQLGFIYLQRDPKGVVASFAKKGIKQPSKSYFKANLYYLLVSLLCKYTVYQLKKKKYPVIEIRYEDLIARPVEIISDIQDKLDLDLINTIDKVKRDETLQIGPLFEGNRLRLQKNLKLITKNSTYPKNIKNFLTRLINLVVYR
ncbi:MAG: sulfotransferase [Thioploca sp.]|nr:sulfotransferase [Thioploca sp.]